MYDRILVPTDGSAEMTRVSDHAMELAKRCEAALRILYVVDESSYATVPESLQEKVRAALVGDGESATRSLARRVSSEGIPFERQILVGNPATAIIRYAEDEDCDLIVMGTHGRTGQEYYLLGSVAEKVVQFSAVPVLTIRLGDADGPKTTRDVGAAEPTSEMAERASGVDVPSP
jgi:nucleotide-binding universal stress UspA family protein